MSAPNGPASAPANPLVSYMRALRAHPFVIIAVILVAVGAAAFFTRTRTYEATAEILATPISPPDRSFIDLPLPRAVGDPTRIVQTEADIVDSPAAAALAAKRLPGETPLAVRNRVSVTPSATGNIVDVTARASDPSKAAAIANTYARAALAVRKRTLRPLVAQAIQSAKSSLANVPDPNSETAQIVRQRLVDLRSLRGGVDPTLSLSHPAVPPSAPAGLPRSITLLIALLAGTAIGLVTSLLLEILVPRRVKNELDVLHLYGLPVLARVPFLKERRWDPERPLDQEAPLAVEDAFRALRTQVELRSSRRAAQVGDASRNGRVVAVAGTSRGAGVTTTAIGLAMALTRRQQSVLLIDLDLRQPSVAPRLGIEPRGDLASLLAEGTSLADVVALVRDVPRLAMIAAPPAADLSIAERISAGVPELLSSSRFVADWVIVDVAPVTELSDLLMIGYASDDLLLVSRLGFTHETALTAARDFLESLELTPAGHVLVGTGLTAPLGARVTRALRPAAAQRAGSARA
jgi:Mrp family chromosome partitioning ATPase/capsular polysaccharide biosynthesis protein